MCDARKFHGKSATAAVFSALGVIGLGLYGTFSGSSYLVDKCNEGSNSLTNYLNLFLNGSASIPSFAMNVSLASLPKIVTIDQNVTVPGYPNKIPFHADIPLNIPDYIPVSTPRISIPLAQLSVELESLLKAIPRVGDTACNSAVHYASLIIGIGITFALAWQLANTLGFGFKICSHEKSINKIQEQLPDIEMGVHPKKN